MASIDENLNNFFKIYGSFLAIDSFASITKGRNRDLIVQLFYCYCNICKKNKKHEDIELHIQEIFKMVEEYAILYSECANLNIWNQSEEHSKYINIVKSENISNAFLKLLNSIRQYNKWRTILNKEDILKIYEKNLIDRQKYYANDEKIFCEINEVLKKIDLNKIENNKILKQTLIEFHNAISHLTSIYYGKINEDKNKNRAINHFKRGALDSYKAIIKDFFFIDENNIFKYKEEILEIRKKEFSEIGQDKIDNLLKLYQKITDEIIEQYSK